MDDYVSKPIREAELAATLRRADSQVAEKVVAPETVRLPPEMLDRGVLDLLAGSSPAGLALVEKLIGLFQRDTESLLSSIRRATEARDWTLVARQAHSFKGMAGTLGASRLGELADRLEHAAMSGNPAEADAAVAGLAKDSPEVMRLLLEWETGASLKEPSGASLNQVSAVA
jgi:HPt (histidine-containing phosphotransfer) domain-containing protein